MLNPGGGWASKLWPAERFGELAQGLRALGLPSLVSWGPGEEALADRVVAASGGAAVRSFPTSLLDYVELARRARLVVAADTGPLHLACAVGTPVVALFGPTDPVRNGPFAPDDVVLRRMPGLRALLQPDLRAPRGRHGRDRDGGGPGRGREAPRHGPEGGFACPLGTASPRAGRSACWWSPSLGPPPRPSRSASPSPSSARGSASGPPGTSRRRRALATGGPYAHSRNPLYVGSLLLALGVAVACASPWVVLAVAAYFLAFYPSVMREEAAFLAQKFPEEHAAWASGVPLFWPRPTPGGPRTSRFDWARVRVNREWRTAAALPPLAALLLALPHLRRVLGL